MNLARPWFVALFLVVALTGCDFYRPAYTVRNGSDQPVDVYLVSQNGRDLLADNLPPGLERPVNRLAAGECHEASVFIEALDQDGNVVTRFEGPICEGRMYEIGVS